MLQFQPTNEYDIKLDLSTEEISISYLAYSFLILGHWFFLPHLLSINCVTLPMALQ